MKTGRFFWGAFFVVIGLLLLFNNLGYLHIDWGYSWRLWPLILIFWGLSKFTENRAVKAAFASFNGIVLACMVFGFFSFQWVNASFDDSEPPQYSQHFSEPFDSAIDKADFSFNGGAGKFVMEETTKDLVEAQTESGLGRYELSNYDDDGTANVSLSMKDQRSFRFFGRLRNRAEIRLNDQPSWVMRFHTGAARLDLDLSPYKTDRVLIDAGLSSIHIKLGDRSEETTMRIKTGVSTVRIEVPTTAGCEIRDNSHVGDTDYDGFTKADDNTWHTDNFDGATKKIYIDVDTGVSSVRVLRY
jgi:hypothetical protein